MSIKQKERFMFVLGAAICFGLATVSVFLE